MKYHYYLYGRRFVYKSDNQCLEKFTFYKMHHPVYKGYCLQHNDIYDFEIKYIPGKEDALADAVSRVNPQDEMEQKSLDFTIHE